MVRSLAFDEVAELESVPVREEPQENIERDGDIDIFDESPTQLSSRNALGTRSSFPTPSLVGTMIPIHQDHTFY